MVSPVYCPNPTCNALYEGSHDGHDHPREKCYECKMDFCRTCRCPWHTGFTCTEYRRQLGVEDAPLMQLAEEFGWKRCGNCGSMVERLEGCNHIQCTNCSHHFCYRCGGDFDLASYRCRNEQCGIYQDRTQTLARQHVAGAVRRLMLYLAPPPLTDARRAFLQQRAATSRTTIDLALLVQGARVWAPLPTWQREMVERYRCPFCPYFIGPKDPFGNHLGALQTHIRRHCRSPVWACCAKLFLTAEEMDVHVRDRHQDW